MAKFWYRNVPTLSWQPIACLVLTIAMPLGSGAQTTPSGAGTTPTASPAPTTTAAKAHHVHHHKKAKPVPVVVAPVVPPPPPPPLPPAEQPPTPAKIFYDHGNLRIEADNSSLMQTLTQLSQQTGVSIEGMDHDERIYGRYGPSTFTATLMRLLDGAGYSYVIFGGGGGKAPTKILLTPAGAGAGAGAGVQPANTQNYPQTAPQDPNVMSNPSEPVQPKTPQEIFDEMRRRNPQQ
ncbi:MAG: hypothetical protein H0X25_12045 [Acidobacteriales bacterium]|nr:hypothetical protein [Terriglobales bacterium]